LEWAEKRLDQLGFERQGDGRERAYVREMGGLVVYGDPRQTGSIEFRAYTPSKTSKRKPTLEATFKILDGWKQSLGRKLAQVFREATGRQPS